MFDEKNFGNLQDHKFLKCFVSNCSVARENLEIRKTFYQKISLFLNLNTLNEKVCPNYVTGIQDSLCFYGFLIKCTRHELNDVPTTTILSQLSHWVRKF